MTTQNEEEVFTEGFKAGIPNGRTGNLTPQQINDNAKYAYQEFLKKRSEKQS
jgi:hypothetical protein